MYLFKVFVWNTGANFTCKNFILIFKRPTLYEIMFNSLFGGGVGTGLIWVQDLKSVLFDH